MRFAIDRNIIRIFDWDIVNNEYRLAQFHRSDDIIKYDLFLHVVRVISKNHIQKISLREAVRLCE